MAKPKSYTTLSCRNWTFSVRYFVSFFKDKNGAKDPKLARENEHLLYYVLCTVENDAGQGSVHEF